MFAPCGTVSVTGASVDGQARGLGELRERYRQRIAEQLPQLRELATALAADPQAPELAQLREVAHRLKGSGATYGFPAISAAAGRLEEAIDDGAAVAAPAAALLDACSAMPPGGQAAAEPVASAGAPAARRSAPDAGGAGTARVLLAEDDPDIVAMFSDVLGDKAALAAVATAPEALEQLRADPPDILLLDNRLAAGGSGIELLESLSEDPVLDTVQVIMVTADDEPDVIMRALVAGAVDYLVKPLDLDAVTAALQSRLRRLRKPILIADDDRSVRELLEVLFRNAGFRVLSAADGFAAAELLARHDPALAVLDRMMPGMDGVAIMERLQARGDDVPVVFLTAKQAPRDVLEGLKRGAADYVTKPFNPEELLARCEKILDRDKGD